MGYNYEFFPHSDTGGNMHLIVFRRNFFFPAISTGKGNGKPLQNSCLENPMNSRKRQIDRILKEELPRSVGAQCAMEISGEITPERMKEWSQAKTIPSCGCDW